MTDKIKTNLLSIQHLCVSLILIPKGIDKIQHHHDSIGWIILLMGIAILSYFIFQKISKTKNHFITIVVHLFESIALFLTSYVYFQESRIYLPYIILIAAIGYLFATIMHLFKINKKVENL